jgi:prepilin-type N-terminal cleavage/methylation domain-containing protein
MRQQQSGFTLIEIAIVLVIIGLLLGGVLKGQELITQAKIKNVINDFNGVTTAVYGYQDRYKALPGDDANAGARWSATLTGAKPGNGVLDADEEILFWQELRYSGFIAGDPTAATAAKALPLNAAGGQISAHWVTATGGLLGFATPGLAICSDNLPGKIAESVDLQLDDGKSNFGSVRAGTMTASATQVTNYLDDTTTLYNVCKSL